ncbi:MAG TPA: MBL fold metallo-hydrolase [Acidimicrobiia bacterium]|nr:MBL fold metallo-hydrolase [Acidimicrobiia bacterium]
MSEPDRTTRRFQVGETTITSVVEEQTDHIPPELFFPDATGANVLRHDWLRPGFADDQGAVSLRIQAFVIEHESRVVLVDPCVGNGKQRSMFFWNDGSWPFLERFAEAGFEAEGIDTVIHTHLHADHVGWDTRLVDGQWVPTFTSARHLYTERELEFSRALRTPEEDVYGDSVEPIVAAGLADVVAEDADLGDGLRLEPTPGHTPGHVSLWVESAGEVALISGDFVHHPVQCAEPEWREVADADVEAARATRRRMLHRAAETGALFLGTHFGPPPAGHVLVDGDVWRFVPSE